MTPSPILRTLYIWMNLGKEQHNCYSILNRKRIAWRRWSGRYISQNSFRVTETQLKLNFTKVNLLALIKVYLGSPGMTVAFRHIWAQKLKWWHHIFVGTSFSQLLVMNPLYMVWTMTANRPNFCQPWLATPIREHFSCIFVPGKTGQPILGHVYHDPSGGPLWWTIHLYFMERGQERSSKLRGGTLKKREEVDSEHLLSVFSC